MFFPIISVYWMSRTVLCSGSLSRLTDTLVILPNGRGNRGKLYEGLVVAKCYLVKTT